MTGDRMKILMLNLPLLMRDLLRPEARYIDIILTYSISATIPYPISRTILCTILGMLTSNLTSSLADWYYQQQNSQCKEGSYAWQTSYWWSNHSNGKHRGGACVQVGMAYVVQLELLQQKSIEVLESFINVTSTSSRRLPIIPTIRKFYWPFSAITFGRVTFSTWTNCVLTCLQRITMRPMKLSIHTIT